MNIANIRRIDTLGRICLPMEIRRLLNINTNSILEIYVDGESIVLKKYDQQEKLIDALNTFKSKFEFESLDLKYRDMQEIKKRIKEIEMILCEMEK